MTFSRTLSAITPKHLVACLILVLVIAVLILVARHDAMFATAVENSFKKWPCPTSTADAPLLSPYAVKNVEESSWEDVMLQGMLERNESEALHALARWELVRPPTLNCTNRRGFGQTNPRDPQAPYSVCMDEPYGFEIGNCLVYSYGIAEDWLFDDAIAQEGKCEVLAFDPSMGLADNTTRPSGVVFYKIGLSHENSIYTPTSEDLANYRNENPNIKWTMETFSTTAKRFKHENRIIDVLKVDAETAEIKSIIQALDEGWLQDHVMTLTLEWHLWEWFKQFPKRIVETIQSHRKLRENGFELYYSDPRQWGHRLFPLECYVNKRLAMLRNNGKH